VFLARLAGRTSDNTIHIRNFFLGMNLINLGLSRAHREWLNEIKIFKTFCKDYISKRTAEITAKYQNGETPDQKNMMTIFIEQRMKNQEDAFNDQDIIDEFVTFFVAGMETTGHAITMACHHLYKNPECKEQLMKDVNSLTSPLSYEKLHRLEYLTAFIKETLRMTSPAPMGFHRVAL